MARELPDSGIRHVRDNFDDAWILDQVRTGNLTPEDASAIFALPLEEGILTAPETIQALTDITSALGGTILGSLDDFVQAENLLAEELYGNVMGDYMAITESIEEMADRLVSLLRNDIASDLGAIDSSLDVITQAVLGVPTAQVQAIANLEGDISDKVFGFLGDQSELILNVLGRETDDILGELSEGWDLVQSTTEEIVTKTTDFASALRETIPEIGEKIVEGMAGIGGVVTEGFGAAFGAVLETIGVDKLFDMFSLLGNIGTEVGKELGGLDDLEVRPGSWDAPLATADAINTVIGGLPWVGNIIHTKHPLSLIHI